MKKTLIISLSICLVLVAAYGAAVYWIGEQALKQHDQLIAQINHSNYLEASPVNYERGLFRSTARTTLTLTRFEKEGSIRFNIISSIYHGPFVFINNPHFKGGFRPVIAVIRTKLAPGDCSDAWKKTLENIPELESSQVLTVLFIDGGAETYIDIPSFQKEFSGVKGEKFKLQWDGFTGKSKFDLRLDEITGSFNSPSLEISGKDQLLRLKNMQFDFDSHSGPRGISVGSAAFSIGGIEGREGDDSSFNLSSVGLKAESGVSGETIGCSFWLRFEKFNAGGLEVGPFAMEFEARKLDVEVLSRFQKLAPEFREKARENSKDAEQEMEKLAVGIILDLLAKSPEFEIKQLKLKTDKGDLSGRAKLGFADPVGNPSPNVIVLLRNVDAIAELTVSEPLLLFVAENVVRNASQDPKSAKMGADAIIMGLMAAKYITLDGGSFKSNASYKHGVLAVNGRKLDLSGIKHKDD